MVINQGDVFWVDTPTPEGSGLGYLRPYVIIQNNAFNYSRINTVVICSITSNIRLARSPGNVLLAKGEANLPKQSVVNISQLFTVDKAYVLEKIGSLSQPSFARILAGIYRLLEPREPGEPQAF